MAAFRPPLVDSSRIRALAVAHLDNAGISRLKLLPQHKVSSAGSKGATMSLSVGMLFSVDDHVNSVPELDATVGDLRAVPDMSAVALLDEQRGLAWAPADIRSLDGSPHSTCQRSLLAAVDARARQAGLDFLVGFEIEFTLFTGTKAAPVLAHTGPGYGMLPFLELESWHLDLLDALAIAGVPAEQLHPEYGPGQLELSLAPRPAVRAVDDYVLARQVITRVSQAHGLLVSFAPVPVVGAIANGCHVHLSATRDGRPVFHDPGQPTGFSPEAGHLVAGVLEHLDEGVALLGGSTLSFERLRPHNWAGAYVCWGTGNREAAVRYMPGAAGFGGEQSNIEIKCVDPAANQYLAVAALMGSALDGLDRRLPLPAEVQVEPGTLGEAERAAGRVRPFPPDLGAALQLLAGSPFFAELLGPVLHSSYCAVRQHDWETFGTRPPADVAAAVRWRF
ncbi:glutamine synthetase [Nakamurella endophytica]|uniref:Glutamine synthetase n=1 Tax=Nakamurella endophytica TaxID=1748367 RepID=A0A917WFJ9_9ACTN|nr:glutamine synthetase [Nakamurella endophytica]GGL99100.1 glutamine synthetase [Nakamurella endophytica]